ncbi:MULTISPECIES: hypothetical protein [unclassified Blastococcus]
MTEQQHSADSPWQRPPEGAAAGAAWSAPLAGGWTPPAGPAPLPPPAAPAGPRPRPVRTALGVAAVAVLGTAAASAVAVSLVLWRADDVGGRFGAAMGAELGAAQNEAFEDTLAMEEEYFSSTSPYGGSVDQQEPVPPGQLGVDPVLDRYAQDCFGGDLQSCDDLFYESPPFSEYERYGATCGGRVKPFMVPYCTELG